MLPLFSNTTRLDKIPIRVSTQAVRHREYFHFHRHIQLCFVLSGKLKHPICENEYILQPGSCTFLLPHIPHVIDSSESEDTPLLAHIWFHENFLNEHGYALSSYGEYANFNGYKIPVVSDFTNHGDAPVQIMHEIINEFSREKSLSFKKMAKLTAELFSLACTEPAINKNDSLFKKQLTKVEAAINHIENHFQEKLSLDDLSEVAGMPRRSFTRQFKCITHLTPLQYILSVRLQKAFQLLKGKEMLFDEIARNSGLGNHTNLARTFVKNLGVTPSQFVDEYIKNTSFPHVQSIYNRYRWLFELQSSFNDKD